MLGDIAADGVDEVLVTLGHGGAGPSHERHRRYHFTGGPCAELVALGAARAGGGREITTIVAVGNHGRGPAGLCGRDRQVLFDYHPAVRVILPTEEGVKSVLISDLMPLAALWTVEGDTQPYSPALFTGS